MLKQLHATCFADVDFSLNLVPRACDPWEGNEGSGIIHVRNEYDWLLVYNGMLQCCKN
jgi:hypothetical protein